MPRGHASSIRRHLFALHCLLKVLGTTEDFSVEQRGAEFVHIVDKYDIIRWVNHEWREFAANNGAEKLAESAEGTELFSHISGAGVASVYQAVADAAREMNRPVRFTYRCDSPTLRRYLRMTVTPFEDGALEYRSVLLRVDPREVTPILDAATSQPDTMLRMCSFCRRIAAPEWIEIEEFLAQSDLLEQDSLPKPTHGVCPNCRTAVLGQLRSQIAA